MTLNKIAIIGLGLIGGSLGLCWRSRGAAACIAGFDRDRGAVDRALELGAIDLGFHDLRPAVADADLVVLAVPVGESIAMGPLLAQALREGKGSSRDVVVSDVGSVKENVVRAMEALPPGVAFVGGHPMAGSERGGIEEADPYLFENAVHVFTPGPNSSPEAIKTLVDLAQLTGARPLLLDPAIHDLLVATISHLPQLVAVSLVNTAARVESMQGGTLALAAGGFKDTTRIAASPGELWAEICEANRDRILTALDLFRDQLDQLERAIRSGERQVLLDHFAGARRIRESIPGRARGLLPALHELVVRVEDRPGAIARITVTLGEAGINVCDIEIMRVREGEAGTIRLGFATAGEMEAAVDELRRLGLEARPR